MSCPNPGQNLTTTVREQFIFKTIKKPGIHHAKQNGSRVTFNSVLHTRVTFKLKKITSREHEKILLSVITIHEQGKIQITIHEEKNSLKHASRKKDRGPLVNHGSRRRASFIYFIKYLTYLHLDHALIWLLNRFKRFSVPFKLLLDKIKYNPWN